MAGHIDLYVSRPSSYTKEDFKLAVCGSAKHRVKEAIEKPV